MNKYNKYPAKGFTLVEIMIVVVIIGLLAAMAIPAFNKVRYASRQKAITNNLRQILLLLPSNICWSKVPRRSTNLNSKARFQLITSGQFNR